jgi:hypothetical protein
LDRDRLADQLERQVDLASRAPQAPIRRESRLLGHPPLFHPMPSGM